MHEQVLLWLKDNTNHSFNIEADYNYEPSRKYPNGSVKVHLILDEAALGKLTKFLNPDRPKSKGKKGMPPK
jgi:hypothetical protein